MSETGKGYSQGVVVHSLLSADVLFLYGGYSTQAFLWIPTLFWLMSNLHKPVFSPQSVKVLSDLEVELTWHAHGSTHPAECRCPFPVWWFNIHWTQVPVCLPTLFWAHDVLFKSLQISCIYEDWRNFKITWMWPPQLPDTLPKYNVYRQNCLSLNRLDWVIEYNLILLTLSNGKCKCTCWQNIVK